MLGTTAKRPVVEPIASCFADGDDLSKYCKSRRQDSEGKVVTTRCIGPKNQQADPKLRGKCAEKICAAGSNTDCFVKGPIAVLDQYTELTTAQLFNADEGASLPETKLSEPKKIDVRSPESKATDTDSSDMKIVEVRTSELRSPKRDSAPIEPAAAAVRIVSRSKKSAPEKPRDPSTELSSDDSMQLVLKPVKKTRTVASVSSVPANGFKRFCVARTEVTAPKNIRGKCAIRTCNKGRCAIQGRKDVVDWAAQAISSNTN